MRWGLLVPHTAERDAETFAATRTTLFALLRGSRAVHFCIGSLLGLAIGFVLGIGAVAWW